MKPNKDCKPMVKKQVKELYCNCDNYVPYSHDKSCPMFKVKHPVYKKCPTCKGDGEIIYET